MNIKRLAIVFFTLIGINSIAQKDINFGIKGGFNYTGFHTENSTFTDTYGFNIGGMAEIELNNSFSIQAELLYNSKGGLLTIETLNNSSYGIKAKLGYIDIPIQVKYYLFKKLSLDFGTQIGFLVNSKGELFTGGEIDLDNIKTVDLSINGGLSYKFKNNFIIQSRYNYGLSELIENTKYKNSMISLSLGYYFK